MASCHQGYQDGSNAIEQSFKQVLSGILAPAKESKGTGTLPVFQFTSVGHIIAWIVESMSIDKRQHAINQLYELFQDNFKDRPSCTDMFNSIYYRKIKEHGLFGDFVDRYREQTNP